MATLNRVQSLTNKVREPALGFLLSVISLRCLLRSLVWLSELDFLMGKKRKHSETAIAVAPAKKKDEAAPERPQRTLFGWKDEKHKNEQLEEEEQEAATHSTPLFRNKEKVLVTCSRRINFRSENPKQNNNHFLFFYIYI